MNDDFNDRETKEENGYDPEKEGYYPDSVSDADSFRAKKESQPDDSFRFHSGTTDRGNFVAIAGVIIGVVSLICAGIGVLMMLFIPIWSILCRISFAGAFVGFIVSSLGVSYSRKRNGHGLAIGLGGSVLSALAMIISCAVLFFGSCLGCSIL